MLFDDTVYKCSLHSIGLNIRVNNDWSKRKNIAEAETLSVKQIMVQPTLNPNVYREIITGMLIPVYRVTTKFGLYHATTGDKYYKVPKSCAFIKIEDRYAFGDYSSSLEEAGLLEVEEYMKRHDAMRLRLQLYDIFQRAESYYETAALRGDISDKAKIKTLMKSVGKN